MVAKSLSEPDRRKLLEEMSTLESDADLSPEVITKVFLPLPEHRRVLDDRVVLVLGERGVGKSALFHFLQTPEGAGLLGLEVKTQATQRTWIVGFSETGMEHAPPWALEELARGVPSVEDRIRRFWLGHLIGRIASAAQDVVPSPPGFVSKWKEAPTDPAHWLPSLEDPAGLLPWLDQLERNLTEQGRTLVVTYDHLDKIGVRSRDVRRRVLPPLLALWLSLSNRYRRIRAKIFLRRDLFDESVANTADVSKLLARAETLRWSVSALYRLLLRHLAIHDGLRKWLGSGQWKLNLTSHEELGWMPPDDLPETGNQSQAMLMSHIVGERMGSGKDPRSGYSWTWVPNHLKDAQGIIAPRSIITLFNSAASHALSVTPSGKYMRILAPEELKEGLRETSQRRVVEMQEEHPVVMRLGLLSDISLPASVDDVVETLSTVQEEVDDGFGTAGERILDELARLGVVYRLPKGRIDIPDIYRLRFKISRKGQKVTPGG
ncbi:hypothetical protein GCM10012319_40450 [Comamonas sp. KCTC 72670]|nr:hypothetical protein GCM10012319_40450 [Comamonas sp. KCTC 72670]